jgi:hypothetical protein
MELFITIVGSEYLFNKQTALYPVTMGGLQSSWIYISNYEMLYETTLSSEEKEKARWKVKRLSRSCRRAYL